ncbi:glycosyltransferase family 4 protein [Helicobacter felis]|uniref:glycosyltransferase family 4 protein n=1 Tax=Helicobacter felis TaxID=214 RepID=UPI001F08D0F3|nr:glycosyltransferase family 1 protein [Helicobacter felis]
MSVISGELTGLGVYALTFARTLEEHFKNTDVSVTFYANECFYTDLNAWLDISLAPPPPSANRYQPLLDFAKAILGMRLYLFLRCNLLRFIEEYKSKTLRKKNMIDAEKFDLYIELSYLGTTLNAQKTLGCIHDLPLCDEQAWFVNQELKMCWKHLVLPKMAAYTEVICFSQCVKKEILKTFGFSQEAVHTIYHGLREYRDTHLEAMPSNLGEFILVVGAKAKRRNVRGLIDAFKLLPQELQNRFKIVLTGAPNNLDTEDEQYFKQDFIINLGYVSDALLQTLYAHAHLLWWGSFAEGFGLPMVEAMRASCVVLASDVSCMSEILGDASFYCNPYNVTDIAKSLKSALTDEALRQKCIQKGLERSKFFDFKKSMQKHLEIVERMLGE